MVPLRLQKNRRTKELVTLFAIWVASYMLNSLVAYADQIETKGRKVYYLEAFASLPDQFNNEQLREVLASLGITSLPKKVIYRWISQNHVIDKVDKGIYRKVKHAE